MLLDPFLLMLLLLVAASGFIAFLFLPAIIEILKPKDRGPRRMLRTPFQKIMRNAPKSTFALNSNPDDSSRASKSLQSILNEAGVKTSRIGNDTVRIFGDVMFPPNLQVLDNIVVEGTLTVGDGCSLKGSVKAHGSVLIGNNVVVSGNVVSKGDVDIKDEAVVGGAVHADGSVKLGEKVFVGLSVVAGGDVELYENSEVKKNILANGVIKVLKYPNLDFPTTLEDIG